MAGTKSTNPVWSRPTHGYIGRIPRSSEGGNEWTKSAAYLRTHQRAYQTFAFSGPTDPAVNPLAGDYYVIHHEAPKFDAGTTRNYAHQVLAWRGCEPEANQQIIYYPDYADAVTHTHIYTRGVALGEPYDTVGDRCRGELITWRYDQPIGIGEDNQPAFTAARIQLHDMKAAAVSVWSMPDVALDLDNQILREWECRPNQNIRGYSTTVDTNQPQLGNLRRNVHYQENDTLDTVEMATRRCLFQTGHPVGFWTDSSSFQNINGNFRFPVYTRNLVRGASDDTREVVVLPAIVVSCTEGASVEFDIGGYNWIWVAPMAYSDPTLIFGSMTSGDCIKVKTGDDPTRYCRVRIKTGGGEVDEILLHTCSLWEHQPYPATFTILG